MSRLPYCKIGLQKATNEWLVIRVGGQEETCGVEAMKNNFLACVIEGLLVQKSLLIKACMKGYMKLCIDAIKIDLEPEK